MLADAEIINLTLRVFKELKIKVIIKVNNRKILDGLMEYCKVDKEKRESAILSIDKLEKIKVEEIKKELKEKKLTNKQIEKLIKCIKIKGSNKENRL